MCGINKSEKKNLMVVNVLLQYRSGENGVMMEMLNKKSKRNSIEEIRWLRNDKIRSGILVHHK